MYYEVLELACLMMGGDYETIVNEGDERKINIKVKIIRLIIIKMN